VTLNAIDQTLPQLLARISRQIDMRYEIEGGTLFVLRDTPFLRIYKVDFLSSERKVEMRSNFSTQFSASSGGGSAGSGGTGANTTIEIKSTNRVWDSIVENVKEILRETDRILPASTPASAAAPQAPQAAAPGQPAPQGAAAAQASASQGTTFQEAASVIANRESGVLFIRAKTEQHERIREFLDQVLASVRTQVLIEATVAEVQLNNQYQRGIDWSRIRRGASGFTLRGVSAGTPAGVSTSFLTIDAAAASFGFQATMQLLESFGDVRVLSSPKLAVMNNQAALLRVTRDIVYFTVTPATVGSTTATGGGTVNVAASFTTTPNVAAEGFMMSVLPQISESKAIVLNVRPTIRRRVADATDPNPGLTRTNLIPVFETREFESLLRLQSGEIAVLGGLMQDSVENLEDRIPGIGQIPVFGELFKQKRDVNRKTELVIFLRAVILNDPSIDGDLRDFRALLPTRDFFRKPNPGRIAPPILPGAATAQ